MQEFLIEAMKNRAFQLTLTENRDTISYGDVGEWLFEFSTLIAKNPDIYVCVETLLRISTADACCVLLPANSVSQWGATEFLRGKDSLFIRGL